jgi:hypothetical protein
MDRRFAIHRLRQELLVGRRHENEENATVICNLHGGVAERRAGSGGTSSDTKASVRPRDDAPLAAAPDSARRRWLDARTPSARAITVGNASGGVFMAKCHGKFGRNPSVGNAGRELATEPLAREVLGEPHLVL